MQDKFMRLRNTRTLDACPFFQRFVIFIALLLTSSNAISAESLPSFEESAKLIQAATVTVRVTSPGSSDELADSAPKISVFTGVSLGDGLIVTPLFTSEKANVRITLVGGEQAKAQPRIADEPSGLFLLQADRKDIPGLKLAKDTPSVGSWVISAAGWGVEKPVVSFGMVSGVDRRMPGANYPPLLSCDLTTTETSSGAPIVNRAGALVGVIIAADRREAGRGWTYAVPAKHVERLLRVHKEKSAAREDDKSLVVIPRRRPIVGMEIGGQLDEVVVKRVFKNGPAARAGIKADDQIIAVDGVKIRSPYQAVNPTLFKQPGDTVNFLVQQTDGTREIKVILGGGVALPKSGGPKLAQLIEPKIVIDVLALRNQRGGKATIAELFGDEESLKNIDPDDRKLLEKAIERYLTVIEIQQRRLTSQQQELGGAKAQIQALEAELEALKWPGDRIVVRNYCTVIGPDFWEISIFVKPTLVRFH